MALVKLEDFYPDYSVNFYDLHNIKTFDVYTKSNNRVGLIHDILVDETTGNFRYFVVDTGFWVFGKKVLLPVGLADVHYSDRRIYVKYFTKEQVKNLPNFDNLEKVDYAYEEQVRGVYRASVASSGMTPANTYDSSTYNYEQEPSLYNIDDRDNQSLKLYEERLIANTQRRKTGEVKIGKHLETDTARVAVPVEKERVVIERTNPTNARLSNSSDAFRESEVARIELYEETPDIHKEAVVREEVQVKKVVERDTVQAEDTVRREELDVDTDGSILEK